MDNANDMKTVAKLRLQTASRKIRRSNYVKELDKGSPKLSAGRKST